MVSEMTSSTFPQRAVVIIDGGYLRKVEEQLRIRNIDLCGFTDRLCKPAYRIRSFYFDGRTQQNQSFHDYLQIQDRFDVVLGDVVQRDATCPHCNQSFTIDTQKRVDVALAVELVHQATAKNVDLIALVAGDRDFLPAVAAAKHAGVIIRLIHGYASTVSTQLYQNVDERVEITKKALQDWHVRFESTDEKQPAVIKKKTAKPSKEMTSQTDKESKEIYEIFRRLVTENIAKTGKKSIPATTVGIAIKKIEPNWIKKYKVTMLKDLVALVGDKVRWEEIGNQVYYVSLIEDEESPQSEETENPLRIFLLDTLTEYFKANKAIKSINGPDFGQILYNKDEKWKKTYEIKSLTDALEIIKDKIVYTGKGPFLSIKMK